jgi:hypothetical protein
MYYLDLRRAPEIVVKVCKVAFPDYTGTKVKINAGDKFYPDQSWSGGSRKLWKLVSRDGKLFDPGTQIYASGPFNPSKAFEPQEIPKNTILVEHDIFCGKDTGITLTIRTDENTLLPLPTTEKTDSDILIVLKYTASLKSSYAGIKNYRFVGAKRETGITLERWEGAKSYCMDKKWLTKAGAITPEGRNVVVQYK